MHVMDKCYEDGGCLYKRHRASHLSTVISYEENTKMFSNEISTPSSVRYESYDSSNMSVP